MQSPNDSSKSKAPADERARLRRNQRNSRARKQEYVQDLERRWSDCVRLGVQASVEIQREARRIHEENAVLRCVIRELGVSDEALQQRLQLAMSARDSPAHDTQNGASTAASRSSMDTNANSAAFSNLGTLPPPILDQNAVSHVPDATVANALNHTAISPLSDAHVTSTFEETGTSSLLDANVTDALHTWDLYSWVNDLSNIKDAYSINAQSQNEYNDISSVPNLYYQNSGGSELAADAGFFPLNSGGTGNNPWGIINSQPERNDAILSTSTSNAQFTRPQGVGDWFPTDWTA